MSKSQLERRLRALRSPAPSPGLEKRLLETIPERLASRHSPRQRESWWRDAGRVRTMTRIGLATTGAAVVIWGLVSLFHPGVVQTSWAEMIRNVSVASSESPCVHLVMQTRTKPGEEFSYVNLGGDLQRIEAWVVWPDGANGGGAAGIAGAAGGTGAPGNAGVAGNVGGRGRVRMEKSDLIYLFDGKETVYYRPQQREGHRYPGGQPNYEEFWPAAWLRQLSGLPSDGAEVVSRDEGGPTGRMVLRFKGVLVEGRSPAWFEEYDREVEVEWETASHRLIGFKRWVISKGERVLFSDLESIDYPPFLGDETFRLDLPADTRWVALAEAPATLSDLSPREVADRFWRAACAGEWETVALFCPSPATIDYLRTLRPTELVSLGEPFHAGVYAGVYVPYRVRVSGSGAPAEKFSGGVKEQNLALRNDNAYKRWVIDGGI
jgi:hypothetical protein